MSKRRAKRRVETYRVIYTDDKLELWELRETRSHRYYIYKNDICYGWSFSPVLAKQKLEKLVADITGGFKVRRISVVMREVTTNG